MGIGLLHAGRRLPTGRKIGATIVAYFVLYLIWVAFTQMLLPYLYGIPRTGDVVTLLLIAVPFICACIAMGFAIALAIRWREGVVFFLVVMGMPLFFLSGISWPVEMIPDHLRTLSLLVPSSRPFRPLSRSTRMGASAQDVAGAIQTQWFWPWAIRSAGPVTPAPHEATAPLCSTRERRIKPGSSVMSGSNDFRAPGMVGFRQIRQARTRAGHSSPRRCPPGTTIGEFCITCAHIEKTSAPPVDAARGAGFNATAVRQGADGR